MQMKVLISLLGSKHRLSNPGKTPLILIEVQSGSYLGEDDIIRFEDIYGRSQKKKFNILMKF